MENWELRIENLKYIFYILSSIGFFLPFVFYFLLMSQNSELKIMALYFLPKFNIIYFAVLIVLFFIGLRKNWAKVAEILFIIFYLGYIFIDFFVIAPIKVKEFAKNHPGSKIVKISELKDLPGFELLYKNGDLAVVKIKLINHSNPFGYKKDRRQ